MNRYTVAEAKKEIKTDIQVYLEKDLQGRYCMPEEQRLPFYLQGPPGVGKTQMARQIAEELGIGFVSLSITHHTRNTILGLPLIETLEGSDNKYTEYTMSEMIAMVEKQVSCGYREGIVLVDEFASMAESLVAPMLAFLQTKNIGNHHLPEGWILILCANPTAYNKTARVFDMAIMDRVRLLDIDFDEAVFLQYGREKGFHASILEYLSHYPQDTYLCEVDENGDRSIVTTRGWENLSWCLCGYERLGQEISQKLVQQYIKNPKISYRFYEYFVSRKSLLSGHSFGEILKGENLNQWVNAYYSAGLTEKYRLMNLLTDAVASLCGEGDYKNEREREDWLAECDKAITHVCFLLEAIQGDTNLMTMCIQRLNQSKGVLQVMTQQPNKTYLECNRKYYLLEEENKELRKVMG